MFFFFQAFSCLEGIPELYECSVVVVVVGGSRTASSGQWRFFQFKNMNLAA